MYAYNVKESDLIEVANAITCGFDINTRQDGSRVVFTLKPRDGEGNAFHKLSPQPIGLNLSGLTIDADSWKWRKTAHLCFHGHWLFLDTLFSRFPNARVTSSRYGKVEYTADTFHDRAEEFGDQRMGTGSNIYHRWRIRDCCNCEEERS